MIRSEGTRLVSYTDRPIADYVADAKQAVERQAKLPSGVRLEWSGQFKYFERAKAKLEIVVPVMLLLVILLLYFSTKLAVETGIVLLAVPFSLIGAVWLLYLRDYHMSVVVWVGLIALAGLDAETGVVMLLYLTLAHRTAEREGRLRSFADLKEASRRGGDALAPGKGTGVHAVRSVVLRCAGYQAALGFPYCNRVFPTRAPQNDWTSSPESSLQRPLLGSPPVRMMSSSTGSRYSPDNSMLTMRRIAWSSRVTK